MCNICGIRTNPAYPVFEVSVEDKVVYRAACRDVAIDEAIRVKGDVSLEPRQNENKVPQRLREEYDAIYKIARFG